MRFVVVYLIAGWLVFGAVGWAQAQAVEGQSSEPERGALGYQLLAGGATAAIGGAATYMVLRIHYPACPSDAESCTTARIPGAMGAIFLLEGLTPMLTATAVTLVGNMTDGEGQLGKAVLGSYAAGGLAMLVGVIASMDYQVPANQRTNNFDAFDSRLVVPLTAAGMALGAVAGYQLSVPTPRRVLLAPSIGRNSMSLNLYGTL